MTSARLPGKVLRPLAGRPLLDWLADRLARASAIDEVVIATSTDASDDPIAWWAGGRGLRCFRGPLDDVAGRLAGAATDAALDVVARVSGDSPLLDPAVVDRVVKAHGDADVTTNLRPRTFPIGQSIEVTSTELLIVAAREMTDPYHREHVVPWFYDQPERFTIANVAHDVDRSTERHVVDTPEDEARIDALLRAIADREAEFGIEELIELRQTLGLG